MNSKKRIAAAIGTHGKGFGIAGIRRTMNIAGSTFYASRETTPKQIKDRAPVKQIAAIQNDCFCTIGRRRMGTLPERRFGITVCETALQRIMSRHGLTARIRQVRKAKPRYPRAASRQSAQS